MVEAYENLANAIVTRAADDYRLALMEQKKNANDTAALEQINECEDFFRSEWMEALTSLDGEALIKRLRMDVLEAAA